MAARGREPTDVPGVEDLYLRPRDVDDHHLGLPRRVGTGCRGAVRIDMAKGEVPRAVPTTTGVGPAAGDAIAPRVGDRPAEGEDRPRHDRPCAGPVDRLRRVIAQKRRRDGGTAIDEEAPPGGPIYAGDGLHNVIKRQRIDLQPTQCAGHEHVVEPGVLECLDDGIHEMPLPLPVIGVRVNHGRELLDPGEQILTGDCVCHTPSFSRGRRDHEGTTRTGAPCTASPRSSSVPHLAGWHTGEHGGGRQVPDNVSILVIIELLDTLWSTRPRRLLSYMKCGTEAR